jgi:hypothetical protein
MPRPDRSPSRFLDSVVWWYCPVCPKVCKSKGGRVKHFRTKHSDMPLSMLEPAKDVIRPPPETNLSLLPGQQSNGFDMQEPIDYAASPLFDGMFFN